MAARTAAPPACPCKRTRFCDLSGGRYTIDNVVPACRSFCASKCNDEVTGWMRRKKLDEKRFLVRQFEIRKELEGTPPTF